MLYGQNSRRLESRSDERLSLSLCVQSFEYTVRWPNEAPNPPVSAFPLLLTLTFVAKFLESDYALIPCRVLIYDHRRLFVTETWTFALSFQRWTIIFPIMLAGLLLYKQRDQVVMIIEYKRRL